jgi:uncharacterized protein YegP (UPF0339 family)
MAVYEKVTVYIDGNGKWRWRHVRGSRSVGASTQGYANKWGCLQNLQFTLSANYTVLTQTKNGTPNGRMHQTGVLTVPGTERTINVEVLSWTEEENS